MYQLFKPLLFRLDAERAHRLTMRAFGLTRLGGPLANAATRNWRQRDARLGAKAFGLDFPNRVGLAAGFDKDGLYYPLMAQLGFGHVELGTVTPRPQDGNAKPRLFRLPRDRALINRMGFNNGGVAALAKRLATTPRPTELILGGNIGKNKDTPNERASDDYLFCLERLHGLVDYFAVNVSSPNTPGLRSLQAKEPLTRLLNGLQERNQRYLTPAPILLKIAPDLSEGELDDIIELAQRTQLAGLIATNTTVARAPLATSPAAIAAMGAGGLSGAPVRERANEVLRYLRAGLPDAFPLVGVGGVTDAESALGKLDAGASLVQIYSGLVYGGPGLVGRINRALLARLDAGVA